MSTFYAAIYEHPHGTDVRLFRDEAHAWSWRTNIAKDCGTTQSAASVPPTPRLAIAISIPWRHGEYFSVTPCTPEGSDPRMSTSHALRAGRA